MGFSFLPLRIASAACFIGVLTVGACTPQTLEVTVRRANGVDPRPDAGEPMKVTPLELSDVANKHKPGYFVLRSTDDWDVFFGDRSIRPTGVDFAHQMVLAVYGNDSTLADLKITSAGDAGDTVNVFVTEQQPGDGCKPKGTPLYALAVVDKKVEPVQFYVDSQRAQRCNIAPPAVSVSCRALPDKIWTPYSLKAPLGTTVECAASLDPSQQRTIVDRDWSILEVPRGSDSRLALINEAKKASFVVDAVGTYKMRLAATDEAARTGEATAVIDVPPPSGDLWVELVWSNFTSSDDPDTFPRIELRAVDAKADANASSTTTTKVGGKAQIIVVKKVATRTCELTVTDHPSWCDAVKFGKNTLMKLKGAEGGRYDLAVHYTDDRFPGAPVACVRTFVGGKLAFESCDNRTRKADETWNVGTILEPTGRPEVVDGPSTLDGGVSVDAGTTPDAGK